MHPSIAFGLAAARRGPLRGPAARAALTILFCVAAGCAGQETVRREVIVMREPAIAWQPASFTPGPGDLLPTGPPRNASPPATAPTSAPASRPANAATAQGGPVYSTDHEAAFFYDSLTPYGRWIDLPHYGPAWQPSDPAPGWRPYTVGHWVYADDYGWTWASDEPFGWCTYHYGRWVYDEPGWCWVPGQVWGPAWVVWRYGGGYVGWAPLPPARTNAVFDVEIGIGEPPHWAFVFVEERYLTDVRLREHIQPITRNITLVRVTKNVTRYDIVNGRIVNRGLDVRVVERVIGRPVPRYRIVDAPDPRSVGIRGHQLAIYRPQVPPRPAGMQQRPRFRVERSPPAPPVPLPAELELQRQMEAYHRRLAAEMALRQQRELARPPFGWPRERLLAQHALERRAFDEQRVHEIAARQRPPRTVRLAQRAA